MPKPLKILFLEDSLVDMEIVQQFLLKRIPNCELRQAMTEEEFLEELDNFQPDVILSDNTLPRFTATEALEIFNQRALLIPFILVTGTVSEEFAVTIMKLGADDYILKDRLVRLPAAIQAALKKKKTEASAKRSEEIRKLIMNAALDAIICIDITGAITVWNPRAEILFGWKEKEILGKHLVELIIPEQYREAHNAGFHRYLETGEGPVLNKVIEVTALNHAGEEFPIELAIVPIKQTGNDFFCAFIRDVTEQKKAKETFMAMEKMILEQRILEQKKISNAIIIAQETEKNRIGMELHDNISQILAGTKLHLGLAAKKDEKIRELLKYPMELIDNTVEELRLLSSRQVTPLKNIDLEELVRALLDSLDKSGVNTDFIYLVPAKLLADDLKLNIYRLLQEQVNNIIKHAEATHTSVSIKARDNSIEIIVKDNGKGFNLNSKRKGIGISNMVNRIQFYNGVLQIETEPGNGCKISVRIPC